ncbi:MAG: helix-turn-helix domain-containing protein [Dietzia sp.]
MNTVEYSRHVPSPELTGLVEHYWSVVSSAPPEPLRAVLVPNGRSTIQFCLGRPGYRFAEGQPARPNADVYLPATTSPLIIEQEGASHYVGIQFSPWGARSVLGDAGREPVQVADALAPVPDKAALATDPAAELDQWLMSFTRRRPRDPDPVPSTELVTRAVEIVDAAPSETDVHGLNVRLAVSASTLYRTFRIHTGMSPKQYIQVMRYRAFTDRLLAESGGHPAALLAALSGYADQSHSSRDFVRYTGMSARAFRDAYDGIARLMARST